MHFFIDEGGHFTPNAGISVLCSLGVPHGSVDAARIEILSASADWPRREGELKGGSLAVRHLVELVAILYRHGALLQCVVSDVAHESQIEIAAHKDKQCVGLTKHLLPTHPAELIAQVKGLRSTLEAMPNQLYVQCVLLSDLVVAAAELAAMYYAQRLPDELGNFEWTVDAKDPKRITTQEKWWRETLGPLGESKSREHPFATARHKGFDYSRFDQSYLIEKELWWPDRPRETITGINIKKLISDNVRFLDSRSDVMLQAIDILANFMRRVLMGEVVDDEASRSLGRLQILRRQRGTLQSIEVMSFLKSPVPPKGIGRINRVMTAVARPMLLNPLVEAAS